MDFVDSDKPTEQNTIAEIKEYLDQNKISYTNSMKKTDLLALV